MQLALSLTYGQQQHRYTLTHRHNENNLLLLFLLDCGSACYCCWPFIRAIIQPGPGSAKRLLVQSPKLPKTAVAWFSTCHPQVSPINWFTAQSLLTTVCLLVNFPQKFQLFSKFFRSQKSRTETGIASVTQWVSRSRKLEWVSTASLALFPSLSLSPSPSQGFRLDDWVNTLIKKRKKKNLYH